MVEFHNLGFPTWVSSVLTIAEKYSIDPYSVNHSEFKVRCKEKVRDYYRNSWVLQIQNLTQNPGLRNYGIFKNVFEFENYLSQVKKIKYRHAIVKLRTSSHDLRVETGRHQHEAVEERVCRICKNIEDEIHFVFECKINQDLRSNFMFKVDDKYPHFTHMRVNEKYKFLLMSKDPQLLTWLGKFLFESFDLRKLRLNN